MLNVSHNFIWQTAVCVRSATAQNNFRQVHIPARPQIPLKERANMAICNMTKDVPFIFNSQKIKNKRCEIKIPSRESQIWTVYFHLRVPQCTLTMKSLYSNQCKIFNKKLQKLTPGNWMYTETLFTLQIRLFNSTEHLHTGWMLVRFVPYQLHSIVYQHLQAAKCTISSESEHSAIFWGVNTDNRSGICNVFFSHLSGSRLYTLIRSSQTIVKLLRRLIQLKLWLRPDHFDSILPDWSLLGFEGDVV